MGFILLIVGLAALFFEHWRGERALRAWKSKMEAQGEIFDPNKLWPPANPASREFSNQLAEAVGRLPMTLSKFAGSLAGLSLDESGRARRGSKQVIPPISDQGSNASTWQELETASREAQPALATIKNLMKNPPRVMDTETTRRLDPGVFPNLINSTNISQFLSKEPRHLD